MIFYNMLTGFNTNIEYRGEVFHIQTEDSGLKNPVITTLLYRCGVILATKKASYKELLPEDTGSVSHILREKIKQLMTEQHRSMISDLLCGRFDDVITGQKPAFHSPPEDSKREDAGRIAGPEKQTPLTGSQTRRAFDDILFEHKMKKINNVEGG